MNTKKILFAVAAFGMLTLATYAPYSVSDDNTLSTSIEKKTAQNERDAKRY